ncbi:PqiC family protein [Pseudomonas sp. EpS/L25]|uniref:PqiC family protein n=1 Tax=Pseudomonas sp. EpS/L25 TaxID=1749078 RepID=UPI000743B929|nr:PqiC family protein [Pseudomonas sp. EpS/L25]KUM39676.1 hypothetical protein AR540_10140 [Pseudomonas sp. EpS/L25]
MKRLTCLALPLLLAACAAKAPLNYHTLTSAAEPESGGRAATFRFALQGVSVPPQVDQPQLVIRQGDGIALLENERWIAPLADEIRGALSADLSADLGTLDLGDAPRGAGAPVLRIKVDVQRFESIPGRRVQQDALWTLRLAEPGGERMLTCGSRIQQPAGASYAEVVLAHRQALAQLAKRIEPVALAFVANGDTVCPAG